MNVTEQSLFHFTVIAIVILLVSQLLNRWWCERTYDLRSKTILITGGSRGLGLVMARQLLQAGARLALCARDEAELEQARTELEQYSGEVLALTCNVTDQDHVEEMVQQVRNRFGTIDILINNAGTDIVGPLEAMTMQDYDDTMKLHFWAPLYTTYAVLPEMQQSQAGRIVNISSIGGKIVSPHMVAYCASKFALVGLSNGMRIELAKDGIAVTTVCPGLIHTGVVDHAVMKGQHRQEFAWFSISDSLPLLSASAEQVAHATIAGLKRGDAEVIVPSWVWLVSKLYALFPAAMINLLGFGNQFLPEAGVNGNERKLGKDSHSSWSPSWLTTLSNRAARQNNERPVLDPQTTGTVQQVGSKARSPKQLEVDQSQFLETGEPVEVETRSQHQLETDGE